VRVNAIVIALHRIPTNACSAAIPTTLLRFLKHTIMQFILQFYGRIKICASVARARADTNRTTQLLMHGLEPTPFNRRGNSQTLAILCNRAPCDIDVACLESCHNRIVRENFARIFLIDHLLDAETHSFS